MDNGTPSKDTVQLQTLNRWLIGCVCFIVAWSIALFFYIDKKTQDRGPLPVIMVDPTTGKISNPQYTNLFPKNFVLPSDGKTNDVVKPLYEQKDEYQKMDFVIINYFFIPGLIVDKSGDSYTVMYRNYNRDLETITVPREMLLSPTAAAGVNPASLLGP